MRKFFGRIILIILLVASITGIGAMTINNHIVNQTKADLIYAKEGEIFSPDKEQLEILNSFGADCILVLGAGIEDRETPTPMLKDRLDWGIELYNMGIAPKILLTGDNGDITHNEIHVMLNYTLDAGVPEEDIFCDHAGFSTYDSMYRCRNIFQVDKAIVVTQPYHEYRAMYIGNKLGIKTLGVGSNQKKYSGQPIREVREVAARVKDYFKCIKKPESLCGGEIIPLNGSGIISHGE